MSADQFLLVLNAGSSSLKYALFSLAGKELVRGHIDGIGLKRCVHKVVRGGESSSASFFAADHVHAVLKAVHYMKDESIAAPEQIVKVVHRVVHGGERFTEPTAITESLLAHIKELSLLAPLHNPPALAGILATRKLLGHAEQVAMFDTAFHHTIPKAAFLYGIPYKLYAEHGIRKFGFHGISHEFVAKRAARLLGHKRKQHIITCHLGGGSSITAIRNGRSVDTSMGFTPLDGLIMGTRSGDLDPEIVLYLITQLKYTPKQLYALLNQESGLKGIAGSSDMRELWARSQDGDEQAKLALAMLAYRIAKYIGSYGAACHGIDAIVFTGGIGEHAYYIRKQACAYLDYLGVKLDAQANRRSDVAIHARESKVSVFVIPTDEELAMAEAVLEKDVS